MRIRWTLIAACLLSASLAVAAPQVTSITPSTGPASGGTSVTIRGTDFQVCATCSPAIPLIYFGNTRGQFGSLVNDTTITVVTPPHLPGATPVTVLLSNGTDTVANGFVFTGSSEQAFERVLLPIFTPPVNGAYGSEFVTVLSAYNTSNQLIPIEGLTRFCVTLCPVNEVEVEPLNDLRETVAVEQSGTPGRFIYLPRSQADSLSMNLRVQDVSRDALNFGTEIPIVRWSEVPAGPITLTGVPLDLRFRQALRIYSTEATDVRVRVGGVERIISLTAGNAFDPAYGVFTDFPAPSSVPLSTVLTTAVIEPLNPTVKIWAFVAVTNNETQAITTVTPQ
jgi:hypothetical protein